MTKPILDPCCGSKMFYMDRNDDRVDFCDIRELNTTLCDGRKLVIDPDYVTDVTCLPQEDETYYLVVFDPPHLNTIGETSWMCKKYGRLPQDWKEFMKKAFSECWRVLKPNGTLIFKWNDSDIPLSEVLKCTNLKPLLANKRPKQTKTHWVVFFKEEKQESEEKESENTKN